MVTTQSGHGFYTACVCVNGDVLTARAERLPEYVKPFCGSCGARTIQACQNCNSQLEGDGIDGGVLGSIYYPPRHCPMCGSPFPWTAAKEAAARELAELLGSTPEEQQALSNDVADLLSETPRTPLAAARWKRAINKAGAEGISLARDVFVGVVSIAVGKQLGL